MKALFMTAFMWLICIESFASSAVWDRWKTVGESQLTWGFWVIYDSELRTPEGIYSPEQSQLALKITYRRNIDKDDLLQATDDQWKHLGIKENRREIWLSELAGIWPDIRKGDHLLFVLNNGEGFFYQAGKLLGSSIENEHAKAFVDIWLSDETAYPGLRDQLTGMRE
ncbi:chalcone isomerase family protein [Endozoicomonas arenosclerae]|uniref:chalcone isomerase family protein n=1 Tax=Endozoicomonas arenosclerae TaxID=1633495 RepID=UPI0007805BB4|nr:chalcone isomerase family protein [Endozoicomonas arenosclerae]